MKASLINCGFVFQMVGGQNQPLRVRGGPVFLGKTVGSNYLQGGIPVAKGLKR
jgi:hypothetical protein